MQVYFIFALFNAAFCVVQILVANKEKNTISILYFEQDTGCVQQYNAVQIALKARIITPKDLKSTKNSLTIAYRDCEVKTRYTIFSVDSVDAESKREIVTPVGQCEPWIPSITITDVNGFDERLKLELASVYYPKSDTNAKLLFSHKSQDIKQATLGSSKLNKPVQSHSTSKVSFTSPSSSNEQKSNLDKLFSQYRSICVEKETPAGNPIGQGLCLGFGLLAIVSLVIGIFVHLSN